LRDLQSFRRGQDAGFRRVRLQIWLHRARVDRQFEAVLAHQTGLGSGGQVRKTAAADQSKTPRRRIIRRRGYPPPARRLLSTGRMRKRQGQPIPAPPRH
jgi:hypothetical protein